MRTFVLAILVMLPSVIFAQADAILGTWLTEEGDGKVEIYVKDDKYFGRLIWGKDLIDSRGVHKKDVKNPDETLRNRNLTGIDILTDFEYDAKSKTWEKGRVYDAESGKTYHAFLEMNSEGCLVLTGYVIIKAFSKSTTWTRVE